jgi:hypothetical protein
MLIIVCSLVGDSASSVGVPGTVTRLRMASRGDDFVSVRWDDGGVDSPLTPATEFTLISRQV